jgi:hypothetical protein
MEHPASSLMPVYSEAWNQALLLLLCCWRLVNQSCSAYELGSWLQLSGHLVLLLRPSVAQSLLLAALPAYVQLLQAAWHRHRPCLRLHQGPT